MKGVRRLVRRVQRGEVGVKGEKGVKVCDKGAWGEKVGAKGEKVGEKGPSSAKG